MEVVDPAFLPDPDRSRGEMEALQRDLAEAAVFADHLPFDPAAVEVSEPFELAGGVPAPGEPLTAARGGERDRPLVAGVDQAFLDERALSAVVVTRGDRVVERAHAVTALELPYVPGLLAFREGRPIVAALESLSVDPDLLVFDGSGRIHYRQAGIATHVGVLFDVPAVGVAKNLLCGEPDRPLDEPLPAGTRVDVRADDEVAAPDGTRIGQAFQSRQYDSPNRHVNPLFVSPGHRLAVDTATDLVERTCAGRKLPEPTRLADAHADQVKRDVD